jgi:hypothetical protein
MPEAGIASSTVPMAGRSNCETMPSCAALVASSAAAASDSDASWDEPPPEPEPLLEDPLAVLPPLTLPCTTPTLPPPLVLMDALDDELPVEALEPPAEAPLEPDEVVPCDCARAGPAKASIPNVITARARKRMVFLPVKLARWLWPSDYISDQDR